MTIGEVLRIDMNAASVLMESVCTALAVLHHEAKQLKRLVWYTVQMQTHSLQTLTKQLHNERRICFSLDNRLALCADFVRDGAKVADIGTDHAYLPVWLCRIGRCDTAIAADINPCPLNGELKQLTTAVLTIELKQDFQRS